MSIQLRIKNYFDSNDLPVEKMVDEPYPFAIEAINKNAPYNPEFVRFLSLSCYQGSNPLPESLQKSLPFLQAAIHEAPIGKYRKVINFLISTLPKERSNHPDFILTAIQNAPEPVRNQILQSLPDVFPTLPNTLTKTPLFIQMLIFELPDELREDADYLLSFMEGASLALQDDCEIEILFSLIKNCSSHLSNDPDFLYSMVGMIANNFRNTPSFVRLFMMEAPEDLRDNLAYLIAVIRHHPLAYMAVPEEYRANPNFAREIILNAPAALMSAPPSLRLDQDFLLSVLEEAVEKQMATPNHFSALLCYADLSLQRDPLYIRSILELAPEEFRSDPVFIRTILAAIPADVRQNCDFLSELLVFSGPGTGG